MKTPTAHSPHPAWSRRGCLQTLAAAGGLLSLGAHALPEPTDAWLEGFEAMRPRRPWLMGYEGVQADVPAMDLQLRGRWPADLRGRLYRNGPARHSLGGVRYHHPFDGDGLIQKYQITEQGIAHSARFVRTAKFEADTAAGRPVRAAFGTPLTDIEPLRSADSINVANTSVLPLAGELLALWEGGSATRLDPDSLDTLGLKTWSEDYAGMPFSAHPRVEPDGSLWNFGVSSLLGMMSIYRISASGELLKAHTFKVPKVAMVHDFAVTQRHLVFLLPPLVFDGERARQGEPFLDCHRWSPELGMRAMVIPKDQLDQVHWFDLPAGFVFHLGNAWEQADGRFIRLDYVRSPDADWVLQGMRDLMRGQYQRQRADYPVATLLELDLRSGRARQTLTPHIAEFPRVDPRLVGRRYRQVVMAVRRQAPDERPGFDAVMQLDVDSGRTSHYSYGPEVMVEEHLVVPGRQGPGRGWIVGTALDLRQQAMLLSVFQSDRLADGPVAQATLPRVMPLGLHAQFLPS